MTAAAAMTSSSVEYMFVGGCRRRVDDGVRDENENIETLHDKARSSKCKWEIIRTATTRSKLIWTWTSTRARAGSSTKVAVYAWFDVDAMVLQPRHVDVLRWLLGRESQVRALSTITRLRCPAARHPSRLLLSTSPVSYQCQWPRLYETTILSLRFSSCSSPSVHPDAQSGVHHGPVGITSSSTFFFHPFRFLPISRLTLEDPHLLIIQIHRHTLPIENADWS
jgi:hypothetical protein